MSKQKPAKTPKLTESDSSWCEFWHEFPKNADKKRAFEAWKKINPNQTLFDAIMDGLRNQKQSEQWTKDGGQYIPNAATWLNGERWNDKPTVITAADKPKQQPKGESFFDRIIAEEKARCGGLTNDNTRNNGNYENNLEILSERQQD
ncbi:hypothetical protein AGMMS49975_21200 [Clostridia bacterium]|nr:hypothetical protein AGMMS49975_21200 [Clostridia bacterium]